MNLIFIFIIEEIVTTDIKHLTQTPYYKHTRVEIDVFVFHYYIYDRLFQSMINRVSLRKVLKKEWELNLYIQIYIIKYIIL